jgi:two-component system NtrC family sensor kinase
LEDIASVQKRTKIIQAYKTELENLYKIYIIFENTDGGKDHSEKINQIQETVTQMGRRLTTDIEQVEKLERDSIFILIERSKNYLLVSLLSLFALTVLTAFFLMKNFNRPLKLIEKNIKRIVSGDFNKFSDISTGDEFESLANSLNNMIDELDKRKDQLLQAEKMSSLGTLTSGVAHELNNPLNNISTSIQIVREELEDPEIEFKRNMLIEAEQQVDRARDIIKALLEFSRQNEFSVEPVNFKDLIQSTMHLISGEIPSDIQMQIDVPDEVTGKMDSRRIQQVLLNLIINGVHAMPQGGKLKICASMDEKNKLFVFQVSDTGKGISKANSAKIFDPFFYN